MRLKRQPIAAIQIGAKKVTPVDVMDTVDLKDALIDALHIEVARLQNIIEEREHEISMLEETIRGALYTPPLVS
jgi:hypothetical protein